MVRFGAALTRRGRHMQMQKFGMGRERLHGRDMGVHEGRQRLQRNPYPPYQPVSGLSQHIAPLR